MAWSTLFAALAVLPATTLAAETSNPYTYYGCVASVARAFPHVIPHTSGASLSIAACQESCSYYGRFAALGSQQCRCSAEGPFEGAPVTFQVLDSERCSELCVEGDAAQGICGGEFGTGAWSLWVRGGVGRKELKREVDDEPDSCDAGDGEGTPTTSSGILPPPTGVYPGDGQTTLVTAPSTDIGPTATDLVIPPPKPTDAISIIPTGTGTTTGPSILPTAAAAKVGGAGALGMALGLGVMIMAV